MGVAFGDKIERGTDRLSTHTEESWAVVFLWLSLIELSEVGEAGWQLQQSPGQASQLPERSWTEKENAAGLRDRFGGWGEEAVSWPQAQKSLDWAFWQAQPSIEATELVLAQSSVPDE